MGYRLARRLMIPLAAVFAGILQHSHSTGFCSGATARALFSLRRRGTARRIARRGSRSRVRCRPAPMHLAAALLAPCSLRNRGRISHESAAVGIGSRRVLGLVRKYIFFFYIHLVTCEKLKPATAGACVPEELTRSRSLRRHHELSKLIRCCPPLFT